ncbi:hypothetical protein AZE42_09664 [Rhizopogon vesiculosus]|uniref:Uncharacterized protein n=1 Tax=Rhizopogon vesiculosus TaxID=180088 RepID=A0A1J8PX65_9AGAM|nr:hypothetical protein AZE42_09664 [Rhizopogon vesiculosus]
MFFPVVRDLLKDVESADPDVRHHFDSDNSSALLKNLFHYPSAHNGPGTINQLIATQNGFYTHIVIGC